MSFMYGFRSKFLKCISNGISVSFHPSSCIYISKRCYNAPLAKIMIEPYLLDRTTSATTILQKLSPADIERLAFIKAEHNIFLATGKQVKLDLTDDDLVELLCCPSYSARMRYHVFRFKLFCKRESHRLKQIEREHEHVSRELTQNNQILRVIREVRIRDHYNDAVAAELRNPESAQPLVFDCSHESEMRTMDQKNLAKQIIMLASKNRVQQPFPFNIMLTSVVKGTNQYHYLDKETNGFGSNNLDSNSIKNFLWSLREEHFQNCPDLAGRRLVYLSPNAPKAFELGEYDHNAAYVVGGIVDKAIRRPVTTARARRSGIECVRLPLERYLHWRSGSKTLTLVTIHGILETAKRTNGDWKTALEENIPARFLHEHDPIRKDINRMFRQI